MNLAHSNSSHNEFGEEEIRDIVVRSYSIIGSIRGMGSSFVQVEAREAVVPDQRLMDYSVRIELSTGGDYPQVSLASVGYKDLERFVSMLDKLTNTNISTDRFDFSEVQYELDGFRIIVFNNDRGSLMVALSHEGVTVHFTSVSSISDLRKLVTSAKESLDRYKIN